MQEQENIPETVVNKYETTITMVPFNNSFNPPADGDYLVRTQTSKLGRIHHLSARIKLYKDEKGNELYSIDVNNQKITHISKEPLT